MIVAHALSYILTKATDERLIKGVHIPETGEQATHGKLVDDTHVLIEARKDYVDETFKVFRTMGRALGLFLKEINVKAVYVVDALVPQELQDLLFNWELEGNLSKFLGIFIGRDILLQSMQVYLQKVLERCLRLAKRNAHSLMVRVQIVKQLIKSVL